MRNVSQTIYRCASLVMLGCFIGCGGELTTIARPVQKVTGTITVKGKAEPDVIVTMHPVGGDAAIPGFVVSRGRTDASGAFQITTYDTNDGAPIGKYKLAFSWKGPTAGKTEDEQDLLKEKLAGKYLQPGTSEVEAEVKEGDNQLPTIDLR